MSTGGAAHHLSLGRGQTRSVEIDAGRGEGWYDVTVTDRSDHAFARRLRGHIETGRASISDPALGG